ncbi:putative methyltransferase domain containing protein [Naviculisporaceae sp. PSN 640]
MGSVAPDTALPHLWQKPAAQDLLDCLEELRIEPPVWNLKVSRAEILKEQSQIFAAHDKREIISFLSSIIKSSLSWIDNYDKQEEIWNEASKRLSERCGRTAMGEITRKWPFEDPSYGTFSLTIREPPLTGDSLGLKTWGSSYVLAQLLPRFASGPLAHLLTDNTDSPSRPIEVLELGSGTGLLGLAAAASWQADVVLTDLPNIMPNLAYNADLNRKTIELHGGRIDTAPLTWGGEDDEVDARFRTTNHYKLIIVADPLYDDDHPALLAGTISDQLSLSSDSRVLVMVPQRDETTKGLLATLRAEMQQQRSPLICEEENIVAGEDDWGDNGDDDDSKQVGFWWGIFRRDTAP